MSRKRRNKQRRLKEQQNCSNVKRKLNKHQLKKKLKLVNKEIGMADTVRYEMLKRKHEYIRVANKELIKANAKQPFSLALIRACLKFTEGYTKPVIRVKASGAMEIVKPEVEQTIATAIDVA